MIYWASVRDFGTSIWLTDCFIKVQQVYCSAPITVLGKKDINSIEKPPVNSISTEKQATKRCNFCGEKILVIAKKCKYCGSMLNDTASPPTLNKVVKIPAESTILHNHIEEVIPPPIIKPKYIPPSNTNSKKSEPFSSYDQVPWYRKNWFIVVVWLFFTPLFPIIILPLLITGDIYYEKKRELKTYSKAAKIFFIIFSLLANVSIVLSLFNTKQNIAILKPTEQATNLKTESVESTDNESDKNTSDSLTNSKISTDNKLPTESSQNESPTETKIELKQTWVNDWGNGIITTLTTESCQDNELLAQGYNYLLFSSIPIARLNKPTDAWSVSNDRAITVIGCWLKKEDNLVHAKMKRKKDDKTWEQDFKLDDGTWKTQQAAQLTNKVQNEQANNNLNFALPSGFRLPTDKELAKEPLRKESPTQSATVTADFNGDGKSDYAYLLVSKNSSKGLLAVKLSSNENYDWKILDNTLDWNSEQMGIDLVKPDNYETACGKDYWECAANEPSRVILKNAGILYSPFEKGGAKLLFWDITKKDFVQVVMNE
jgi:hypothetical protein